MGLAPFAVVTLTTMFSTEHESKLAGKAVARHRLEVGHCEMRSGSLLIISVAYPKITVRAPDGRAGCNKRIVPSEGNPRALTSPPALSGVSISICRKPGLHYGPRPPHGAAGIPAQRQMGETPKYLRAPSTSISSAMAAMTLATLKSLLATTVFSSLLISVTKSSPG